MPISKNLESFAGYVVRDFDIATGIQSPETTIYRLRKDQEPERPKKRGFFGLKAAPPPPPGDPLESLLAAAGSSEVRGIVYGSWAQGYDSSVSSAEVVEQIAGAAARLPKLEALFIGDMTYEECEISWITQSDVTPLLRAYPQLKHFGVRGSNGLKLGPVRHAQLKSLTIECGGLPAGVLRGVLQSELPALEHLELYLGEENYGANFEVADLEPLLSGLVFPNLRHLGLRDSEVADEVAAAVAKAPLLARIKALDLSLGNLSDAGAKALLGSTAVKGLAKLDIHHHYVSAELVEQLEKMGPEVDASDPKEADEDGGEEYRYISVGE